MCILEADVESQGLRRRLGRLGGRNHDDKVLARVYPLRRVAGEFALVGDAAFLDQPLETAARKTWQVVCERAVETLPALAGADADPRRLAEAGPDDHRPGAATGVFGTRPVRALTVLVVVMGIVIVIGFGVVAAVIAGRMARGNAPTATAPAFRTTAIDIPKGAKVEAMTTSPDRLVVDLVLPDGERRLVILDLASGVRVGTIELHQAP
jgi:hypothetical protein